MTLDEATEPWGVQVERVEVKDVRVPGKRGPHMFRYTRLQVRVQGTGGEHYKYTSVQVEVKDVRIPGTRGVHMNSYTSVQVERVKVKDVRVLG